MSVLSKAILASWCSAEVPGIGKETEEEADVTSAHDPDHQEPRLAPPPPSLGTQKPARWCGVFESWGVGRLRQPPKSSSIRKSGKLPVAGPLPLFSH